MLSLHALSIGVLLLHDGAENRRPGRFVLTGSANLLLLPGFGDSMAGRMEVVNLQPLTAAEQERKPGRVRETLLAAAFAPPLPLLQHNTAGDGRARSDWRFSGAIRRTPSGARARHREYLRTMLQREVQDVARVRDTASVGRLLKMLSLRTAELLSVSSLGNERGLRRKTIDQYLAVCERLYLVRRVQPRHRNHSSRLIKSPKVQVVDSGLAATLTGFTAANWSAQREHFGHLLESFVVP